VKKGVYASKQYCNLLVHLILVTPYFTSSLKGQSRSIANPARPLCCQNSLKILHQNFVLRALLAICGIHSSIAAAFLHLGMSIGKGCEPVRTYSESVANRTVSFLRLFSFCNTKRRNECSAMLEFALRIFQRPFSGRKGVCCVVTTPRFFFPNGSVIFLSAVGNCVPTYQQLFEVAQYL
jgi:hypothetical protein